MTRPACSTCRQQRVESFTDLAAVLCDLSNRSDRFVIRGKPRDRRHNIRRRLHGTEAAFSADAEGHHWVLFDFDEIVLPLFLEPDDDAELLTGYLVRLLPRPFWSACYFWQWSCGQGVDGGKTLRCHLWFWSREKRTDREMENWALTLNGEARRAHPRSDGVPHRSAQLYQRPGHRPGRA